MINWNQLFNTPNSTSVLVEFASGTISERMVTNYFRFGANASEFRKLVRTHGAEKARALCRNALRRRNMLVSANG